MNHEEPSLETKQTTKIVEYYDERVSRYGTSGKSTLLDENLRLLEIETVISWLGKDATVLDIFCGNGVTTLQLSRRCNAITGVDLSGKMIDAARKMMESESPAPENLSFHHGSVLDIDRQFGSGKFNTVVSIRGLINLPSWESQKEAILKVHEILPVGGKFIFIEGSAEGLCRINELRKAMNLSEISEPWFDKYFDDSRLLGFMSEYFDIAASRELDAYFLLSRVLYPMAIHPEEPEFDSPCNRTARLAVPYIRTDVKASLVLAKCFVKRG